MCVTRGCSWCVCVCVCACACVRAHVCAYSFLYSLRFVPHITFDPALTHTTQIHLHTHTHTLRLYCCWWGERVEWVVCVRHHTDYYFLHRPFVWYSDYNSFIFYFFIAWRARVSGGTYFAATPEFSLIWPERGSARRRLPPPTAGALRIRLEPRMFDPRPVTSPGRLPHTPAVAKQHAVNVSRLGPTRLVRAALGGRSAWPRGPPRLPAVYLTCV